MIIHTWYHIMNKANIIQADILIIGAGPVGLMCAYLAKLSGLNTIIIDKSSAPLEKGRADALNARTLQLLEIAGLFDELYPLGKKCNTSSIWQNGKFFSRKSEWWDNLTGCFHKHFLMLGQSYIEQLLDRKLSQLNSAVWRETEVKSIELNADEDNDCIAVLDNKHNQVIKTKYIIGADGGRSFVRKYFYIKFEITKPEITWAVLDGVINSDFPKVPEIIVFQNQTSDVAWIPREGELDRFYIRMDKQEFTQQEVITKINHAIKPHRLSFDKIDWFSSFTVKESVAENFAIHNKVFLAGDACHIHSVNGGQGLNTGLADAFNLIWKVNSVIKHGNNKHLLNSYESERKPVAKSVIETSGKLVRATKYSNNNTHAQDYLKIIEQHAGFITGMGVNYKKQNNNNNTHPAIGLRMDDFEVLQFRNNQQIKTRLYSLLDYSQYTLLVFDFCETQNFKNLPKNTQVIKIALSSTNTQQEFSSRYSKFQHQAVLVRPDGYISKII